MSRTFVTPETLGFIDSCLQQSLQQSIVILDRRFIIKTYNSGFSKLLESEEDLSGKEFTSFLLPESRSLLNPQIIERTMPVRLNFSTCDNRVISLDCSLKQVGVDYFFFGGLSTQADSDILQKMTILNNEMAALTRELNRKNRALEEAQAQIKILSGIIPICMYCKEIRDDKGYWNKLEKFITEHSEAEFSHGICEKCLEEQFGDIMAKKEI